MTSKKGLIDLRSDCPNEHEQLHTIEARASYHYGTILNQILLILWIFFRYFKVLKQFFVKILVIN